MKILKLLLFITIITPLMFIATSCDGDTTTANNDVGAPETPDLPSFSNLEMETDLFQQHGQFDIDGQTEGLKPEFLWQEPLPINGLDKISGQEVQFDFFPAFTITSTLVAAFENYHKSNINLIMSYLENFNADDAEISGDEFVWAFEAIDPETDLLFSIKIMATVSDDEVDWVVIASADGVFEEQQIMEGSSTADGKRGTWSLTLNYPGDEFIFESINSWVIADGNLVSLEIDIQFSSPETYGSAKGTYLVNDEVRQLNDVLIESAELEEGLGQIAPEIDLSEPFDVEWNVDTGEGSITFSHERYCWDDNQMPTQC